ncbi:MAG: hypothetical protein KA383_09615 [Phycisphaerae bacterium]|nr:hypothetical protein [Phycisphaerae bacterium]
MSPTLNLSLFPPAPRIAVMFLIVLVVPARAEVPWPAEPAAQAVNLTGIEGPGQNDFYSDMSGAAWNPLTRRLWVCRNGPGGDASKFWAIRENGSGGYEIDYRNGNRGEWTGFGDLEGITVAHYDEDSVYVIIEGEERIKEYDVSVYGTATLRNNWNTSPYLPLNGGSGAEGIAFVPDEFLAAEGFVDQNGNPYTSQNGMGGLMFVAHQNGGRLYAFDLNRTNGTFTFVGAYQTGYSESADLAFDRSEGLLYIFHGADYNRTEVVTLGSTLVGGERRLNQVVMYGSPMGGNLEGIAVVPNDDCVGGQRAFFLVIDGGGATSLLLFNQFPCCIGDGSYGSDEDGDGVHDCNDDCPNTPPGQPPNADGCSCSQLDSDGDGVNNCNDACPNTPPGQPPNADGCSCSQLDSDGDGVNNCNDACPNTPPGQPPNADGCSCSQLDSDGDGVNNCNDACPNTPPGQPPNADGCSCSQLDSDGDGVNNCNDDCPNTPPGQPPNADGCSCSQLDSDGDGVNNCIDACPNTPPGQPPNADGCSCSQLDSDGDGVNNCIDDCPNTPPGQPPNADGCSCSQLDSDGDGVNNCNDDCPNTPPGQPPNADGCSCSQLDSDGDGVNNCIDDCPNTPPGEAPNAAGCSCSQLGSDCDDDNVCNGTETCTNGECVAGTPLNCDDGIDCTTDTCDPTAGCVHTDNCRFGEVCDQDTGGCVPLPAPEPLPIEPGDTWRYFKGINSAPPADWTTVPFADSGWLSGPGGFGFGPDCMAQRGTTLSDMQNGYLSVYARRLFHVDEPEMISSLTLTVDYDDAFVAYLNGQEVVRRNVTGNPPAHNQPATQDHECSACGGACNAAEVIDLSAFVSLLENGTNVLAIQAHNLSLGSSDFTLTVLLTATLGPNCQLDGDGDGVGDCDDECPDTPAGQPVNGDGCSCNQLDSDGDGVNNCNDDCPNTPPSEAPNADGCSCSQLDSDGDGVNNCNDACPNTPPGEALNADGCSCSQLDSDGDGVNNCNDACPNTPPGPAPNANGCSCSQLDSDGDGVDNCIDACPNTPLGQVPNADGCSCSQLDCDGDGVNDCDDTCPDTPPDSSVNDCGCAVVPTDPDSPVPPDNPGWEPASVPVEGEDEVVAGEVESLDGNGESCAGQDEDADGVDDCEDECPGTAFGAAVDEHGCSCDQSGDCVDGTTAAPVVGLCGAGLVPGAVLSLAGWRAMRRARAARRFLP